MGSVKRVRGGREFEVGNWNFQENGRSTEETGVEVNRRRSGSLLPREHRRVSRGEKETMGDTHIRGDAAHSSLLESLLQLSWAKRVLEAAEVHGLTHRNRAQVGGC